MVYYIIDTGYLRFSRLDLESEFFYHSLLMIQLMLMLGVELFKAFGLDRKQDKALVRK